MKRRDWPGIMAMAALAWVWAPCAMGQDAQAADIFTPVEAVRPPASDVARDLAPPVPGPPLRAPDTAWIESTLADMTLPEKIGQMIMPGYSSASADDLVNTWKVGGFLFQGNNNTASAVLAATNYLQGISDRPLIFSTDCEAGLGARFLDATRFPLNMGSAVGSDLDLIRQQGRITARECRAIGIQIGFGPVLDVNTEPINPIIGTRAYSDDPAKVAALAAAYVEGANAEGLLCTFKHFPGHGASKGDSHNMLPRINVSLSDLQTFHVSPYAQLLGSGQGDLVMTAHVWYPALDPGTKAWPATLSTAALTGILRQQLDYDGCIITDSFGMNGLQVAAPTYDAVKHALDAGVDIILTPPSVEDTFNGIMDRVNSDEIPVSRIDASVRRILALKSRVGMPEMTTVPLSGLETVQHPDNVAVAEAIGKTAICGSLNNGVLPVGSSESLGIFHFDLTSSIFYYYPPTVFINAMIAAHPNAQAISVPSSMTSTERLNLLNLARGFDKVLVVSLNWTPEVRSSSQVTFVNSLVSDDLPVAYISFGSPYQWNLFPGLQNFLCGFSSHYATQEQMAQVIIGNEEPSANWPVEMPQVPSAVENWTLYR